MEGNSKAMRIMTFMIALLVIAYFVMQAASFFWTPVTTVLAYTYQVEETTTVTGFVVRDETVLTEEDGVLSLLYEEGQRVGKNDMIAVVYSSASAMTQQETLTALNIQLEQLEYVKDSAISTQASLNLDTTIWSTMETLYGQLPQDNISKLDNDITELRSLVLKHDYVYDSQDTEEIDAQIAAIETQITASRQAVAAASKMIYAPTSGLFSAVVDGYESPLTIDGVVNMTPSEFSDMTGSAVSGSPVGKIIDGHTWQYATVISDTDLYVGQTVTLRFSKGQMEDLSMKVVAVNEDENGDALVVLETDQFLSEVTLLREQSADIIDETYTGIRIPQSALRVDEDGQTGVYCLVGMTARFKPVEVIYMNDDFCLVSGLDTTTSEVRKLRSGDQVIQGAVELYDGKVLYNY